MFIDLPLESCEEGEEFLCRVLNEDEPIFRWSVFPDQPEYLVIFHKLFQVRQTHRIRNASFLLAIFGKCTPGNYCNDYQTSHVHTLHVQAIYKHT